MDSDDIKMGDIFGEDADDGISGSIFHEGSGLEVTSYDNGDVMISGHGNPRAGDPLAGTTIFYDAEAGTIETKNDYAITPQGELKNKETSATYNVELSGDKTPPDLTQTDVDIMTSDDPNVEEGHTLHVDGGLRVEISDGGRISQGSIHIHVTNEDGSHTVMGADENTVSVTTADANGENIQHSGAIEMTGEAFDNSDFRHQPALDPGGLSM